MAKDPRKRQKKLERRTAKRKEKRHQQDQWRSASVTNQLEYAENYPIRHCWMTEALWSQGIGWVLISRELPTGSLLVGLFLVDRYCLGVKDTHSEILTQPGFNEKYVRGLRAKHPASDVSAAKARKFVEEAVAYAQSVGLSPYPDYHKVKLILSGIDASECTETFEFGKDGKPLFIAGPYDTPQRCHMIVNTLREHVGESGFHFVHPLEMGDDFDFEEDEDE